jgi:hypothetical protein
VVLGTGAGETFATKTPSRPTNVCRDDEHYARLVSAEGRFARTLVLIR